MKTPKQTSLLLLLCGLAATASAQHVTIYQDTFNRTGDLLGSAPDVRPGNETWVAASAGRVTDGSVLNFTTDRGSAFLPFTPGAGIYELSVRVQPDLSDNTSWHAVGFMQPNAGIGGGGAGNFAFDNPAGGYAWVLLRNNGATVTFAGLGGQVNLGGDDVGTYAGGEFHTLMVRLDTTDPQWSYQAFVNGNPVADVYTFPLGGNPDIGNIGISTAGGTNSVYTYDDLQLTLIPEPSTYALIFGALAFGVILLRRRMRA